MREKTFNPSHLDIRRFAERAASLEGEIELAGCERLSASTHVDGPPSADPRIRWRAQGELRRGPGGEQQVWLLLRARATVHLTCQRCLGAMECPLDVERSFRFVVDEATAATLDIDSDEDVLVESRSFDLCALIEDELLLALPLVPRHEGSCPQALQAPADPVAAAIELAAPDNPFAVLARLKGRKTDA